MFSPHFNSWNTCFIIKHFFRTCPINRLRSFDAIAAPTGDQTWKTIHFTFWSELNIYIYIYIYTEFNIFIYTDKKKQLYHAWIGQMHRDVSQEKNIITFELRILCDIWQRQTIIDWQYQIVPRTCQTKIERNATGDNSRLQ